MQSSAQNLKTHRNIHYFISPPVLAGCQVSTHLFLGTSLRFASKPFLLADSGETKSIIKENIRWRKKPDTSIVITFVAFNNLFPNNPRRILSRMEVHCIMNAENVFRKHQQEPIVCGPQEDPTRFNRIQKPTSPRRRRSRNCLPVVSPRRSPRRRISGRDKLLEALQRNTGSSLFKPDPLDRQFWKSGSVAKSCLIRRSPTSQGSSLGKEKHVSWPLSIETVTPTPTIECGNAKTLENELWWSKRALFSRDSRDANLARSPGARAFDEECIASFNKLSSKEEYLALDETRDDTLVNSLLTLNIQRGLASGYRGLERTCTARRLERAEKVRSSLLRVLSQQDEEIPHERRRSSVNPFTASEVDRIWARVLALGDQKAAAD